MFHYYCTHLVWNGFAWGIEEAEAHFHECLRIAGEFELEELVEHRIEAAQNGCTLRDPVQLVEQQQDRVVLANFEVLGGELSGPQFPGAVDPSVDPQNQDGATLNEEEEGTKFSKAG